MKIAIYGDSFGFEDLIFIDYHKNLDFIGLSWSKMLRESFNVTNFCYPGSDIYFSYNNFIENYMNYDFNIFIFTSPYRLSVKYKNDHMHNHGIDSALAKLKYEKDTEKNKILHASIDYFKYLQNDEKDKLFSDLIRKELKNKKNTIIIDSFGSHGLFNITLMENKVWNILPSYTKDDQYIDLRFCHMTQKNNLIFYKQIVDCIKGKSGYIFDITNFEHPSLHEKEIYLVYK